MQHAITDKLIYQLIQISSDSVCRVGYHAHRTELESQGARNDTPLSHAEMYTRIRYAAAYQHVALVAALAGTRSTHNICA